MNDDPYVSNILLIIFLKYVQIILESFSSRKTKEDAETLKTNGELLTKLESGFIALMNVLVKGKLGEPFSGLMTNFLECSICKELVIEVKIEISNKFKVCSPTISFLFSFCNRRFSGISASTLSAATA